MVRPSVAESFVNGFLAEEEETSKEEGNIIYSLSKTLSDNLVFYGNSGTATVLAGLNVLL